MAAASNTRAGAKAARRGEYVPKGEYVTFAAALKRHRQANREFYTQARLAAALDVSFHAVGSWERAIWAPDPKKVFEAEAVLELPAGTLSRHLGYLPTGASPSVLSAIDTDPKLDDNAKTLLSGMYRSLARRRAARSSS